MHSGGESSAEVLALRALVQEQSARIAELERQLAEAKATADVPVLLQSWNTRVQHALRSLPYCTYIIKDQILTCHAIRQAFGGAAIDRAAGPG